MIKLAVASKLPLIGASTRDTLNLYDVIKELTSVQAESFKINTKIQPDKLYIMIGADVAKLNLTDLYMQLVNVESTLILVNPNRVIEPIFDAGEIPVPRKMILQLFHHVTEDLKRAQLLARSVGGCTIKEASEFAKLTMTRDTGLDVQGLTETRRGSFQGSSGLAQVDASQGFYDAPPELERYVKDEKQFFLETNDKRLIPRGLLLDGPPGTGKTAAAKYIARQWGVPLFRVDIGGTKNKYVGQSEANMLTNLTRLDNEEPCIALIDEVEKVFSTSNKDSSGTTATMMSQLLWWLAERTARVFVVMTTNNAKALPKELHREGRIDESLWFGGLEKSGAEQFILDVLATFKDFDPPAGVIPKVLKYAHTIEGVSPPKYSQASLTKATYTFIKKHTLDSSKVKMLTGGNAINVTEDDA